MNVSGVGRHYSWMENATEPTKRKRTNKDDSFESLLDKELTKRKENKNDNN